MKIISLNINGIRAAAKKGFFDWMLKENPDVICLQEIKAQEDQLTDPIFSPTGYHRHLFPAEKKGYSGVAIYSKLEPDTIKTGLGWDCPDGEGRYIQMDFGRLSVASIYLPSGTSGDERQTLKYEFMDAYEDILKKQMKKNRDFIICGDWNIVHKRIDIKNFTSNQKTSGCLPEERAWLDKLFNEIGYVDAFRVLNQDAEQYTWWSNRGRAWEKNVGWRIDYQVVTPSLKDKIKGVSIYKEKRFSDHAPLIVEYDGLEI